MSRTPLHRLILVLLPTLALATAAYLVWSKPWSKPPVVPDANTGDPFPLPAYSESPYLNVGPEAQAIGSKACAECHKDNHATYLRTAHSRALTEVDPKTEPSDGSFFHAASGHTYRAYRKGGQLHHEDMVKAEDGRVIAQVDRPVRYLMGSGSHARTYMVDVGGFLMESPITYYASKKAWGLSPGYEGAVNPSFERPVGADCLACHSGRFQINRNGAAVNHVTLLEKAIGCENCHGPGSLHQELHRSKKWPRGATDYTIVHPGKLPRQWVEDICAVCHRGGTTVAVRGRTLHDFRPGRPLADYRVPYRSSNNDQMTVVGHVEQLRESACYKNSSDLTCITCHDPHQRAAPPDPVAAMKQSCFKCHEPQSCKLDQASRLKKSPADNCMQCHMPRGDTEVAHVAFTHHRIGRHPVPAPTGFGIPDLVPADDDSKLPEADRKRDLALAYFTSAHSPAAAEYASIYMSRATKMLEELDSAGLCDGEMAVSLAQIYRMQNSDRVKDYARKALQQKDTWPRHRSITLSLLVEEYLREHNVEGAIEALGQLLAIQNLGDDYRMMGDLFLEKNDLKLAKGWLEGALSLRPFRPSTHASLAEVYERLGDKVHAQEQRDMAKWLADHKQQ